MPGRFRSAQPYGTGHINETYAATYDGPAGPVRFIHQRINPHVFREPMRLMDNVARVLAHAATRLAVELAELLRVELLGLFIEDMGLKHFSTMPFAREIHALGGDWLRLIYAIAEHRELEPRERDLIALDAARDVQSRHHWKRVATAAELADAAADERRVCVECAHLTAARGCAVWSQAGRSEGSAGVPGALQRCASFRLRQGSKRDTRTRVQE